MAEGRICRREISSELELIIPRSDTARRVGLHQRNIVGVVAVGHGQDDEPTPEYELGL